jgi:hypothetical protein
LSNIIDTTTNQVPEYLKPFEVFERAGVKIGVIGLVEKYGPPAREWTDLRLTMVHGTPESGLRLFLLGLQISSTGT